MTIRNGLTLIFFAVVASVAHAQVVPASAAQASMQAYGVFSLIGDGLEIVAANPPAASRVERGGRELQLIPGSGFDRAVLLGAREALRRGQPVAHQYLYRANAPIDAAQQRELVAAVERGEWIPLMQAAVERDRLTRMILVTRVLGDAHLKTKHGHVGTGTVDGVGYYVDRFTDVLAADGRKLVGFLAPFVFLRVTEIDVSSRQVLRSELILQSATLALAERVAGRDPWDALTNVQKVEALRAMIQQHVEASLYAMIAPR